MARRKKSDTESETEQSPARSPAGLVIPTAVPEAKPTAVDLDQYDEGLYRKLTGDDKDEIFQLKIVKDDPAGKTHKLKNRTHFWESNEADFRANFEKK